VPHSYIFHGPEGVGKLLLAYQWAKLLLCHDVRKRRMADANLSIDRRLEDSALSLDEIDDCCDACQDCHLVDSQTHPDLHIITRDLARYTKKPHKSQLLTLPIDVIREFVIDVAGVHPSRGRARVFIIDNAHDMNWQGQNSLLKTLEEPPEGTFLILVSSKPDMFLPTVRSRCQLVRFDPLGADFISQQLSQAGIDQQQSWYWADFCDGQLGLALKFANLDFYSVKCDLVKQLSDLGWKNVLTFAGWLVEQAKLFSQRYLKKYPGPSASEATRQGYYCMLAMISHAFSTAMRQVIYGAESVAGQPDQPEEISRLAQKYDPASCGKAVRAVCRAEMQIKANVNPALIFEGLLLDCIDYKNDGL